MESAENKIMTIDEIASYLRIPRSSVYKLAQEGKIPAQKVGKHWRFHRDTIELWMSNQLDDFPNAAEDEDNPNQDKKTG